MRVYNPHSPTQLHPELQDLLVQFRAERNFVAKTYLEKKSILLNSYLQKFNLKSCVVAVSGGIDSAVTLGIVHAASKISGSPIQKIIPVLLPVFSEQGATNQTSALEKGKELCERFELHPTIIDLTTIHAMIKSTVDHALKVTGDAWATGQLVAYTRTPALYYVTSLLSEQNIPGVICGTTNRDEGAYLGFIGKASDGMVDVQLISDLHKSEVYEVAHLLQIPESIMQAIPSGDMYDGRTDEEVFGAPYTFVELVLLYKTLLNPDEQTSTLEKMSPEARQQFEELNKRIESLHTYNYHKYLSGSPAVHLDLYPSGVPDGWKETTTDVLKRIGLSL